MPKSSLGWSNLPAIASKTDPHSRKQSRANLLFHTRKSVRYIWGPRGYSRLKHRFATDSRLRRRAVASAIREIAVDTLVDAIAQKVSDNPHRNKKDGSRDVSYFFGDIAQGTSVPQDRHGKTGQDTDRKV